MDKSNSEMIHDGGGLGGYAHCLERLAKPYRYFLETGSGESTNVLVTIAKANGGHVWSIDLAQKLASTEVLTAIGGDSLAVPWDHHVDVLCLDGCHRPEHLRRELDKFAKWVWPGGLIVADDLRHLRYPRLEPVFDAFCRRHGLPWEYCESLPCKSGYAKVTHRLGETPAILTVSGTDCQECLKYPSEG